MQNLRDQLLKAGLVSKEQSEKAEADAKNRPARANKPPPREQPQARSIPRPDERPIPKLPPLALPGSKAFQRLESLKQQELQKKIRELVKSNEVKLEDGEHRFHFMTRKGKLRRLDLTPAQAKLLEEGQLAIVERPEAALIEHSLVPRRVAEELLALSEKAVRFYNRDGKAIGFLTDEELAKETSSEPEANDGDATG